MKQASLSLSCYSYSSVLLLTMTFITAPNVIKTTKATIEQLNQLIPSV